MQYVTCKINEINNEKFSYDIYDKNRKKSERAVGTLSKIHCILINSPSFSLNNCDIQQLWSAAKQIKKNNAERYSSHWSKACHWLFGTAERVKNNTNTIDELVGEIKLVVNAAQVAAEVQRTEASAHSAAVAQRAEAAENKAIAAEQRAIAAEQGAESAQRRAITAEKIAMKAKQRAEAAENKIEMMARKVKKFMREVETAVGELAAERCVYKNGVVEGITSHLMSTNNENNDNNDSDHLTGQKMQLVLTTEYPINNSFTVYNSPLPRTPVRTKDETMFMNSLWQDFNLHGSYMRYALTSLVRSVASKSIRMREFNLPKDLMRFVNQAANTANYSLKQGNRKLIGPKNKGKQETTAENTSNNIKIESTQSQQPLLPVVATLSSSSVPLREHQTTEKETSLKNSKQEGTVENGSNRLMTEPQPSVSPSTVESNAMPIVPPQILTWGSFFKGVVNKKSAIYGLLIQPAFYKLACWCSPDDKIKRKYLHREWLDALDSIARFWQALPRDQQKALDSDVTWVVQYIEKYIRRLNSKASPLSSFISQCEQEQMHTWLSQEFSLFRFNKHLGSGVKSLNVGVSSSAIEGLFNFVQWVGSEGLLKKGVSGVLSNLINDKGFQASMEKAAKKAKEEADKEIARVDKSEKEAKKRLGQSDSSTEKMSSWGKFASSVQFSWATKSPAPVGAPSPAAPLTAETLLEIDQELKQLKKDRERAQKVLRDAQLLESLATSLGKPLDALCKKLVEPAFDAFGANHALTPIVTAGKQLWDYYSDLTAHTAQNGWKKDTAGREKLRQQWSNCFSSLMGLMLALVKEMEVNAQEKGKPIEKQLFSAVEKGLTAFCQQEKDLLTWLLSEPPQPTKPSTNEAKKNG